MKAKHLLLAACLLFAPPVMAAEDEALAALAKRDWETARRLLIAKAQAGDAEAWFRLGGMNENGLGGPASPSAAWSAFRKAADLGHAESMVRVARAFEQGVAVPRSAADAALWYEKAAKAGNAQAKARLALLALESRIALPGGGDPMPLLLAAADDGDAQALMALDRLEAQGRFDSHSLGQAGDDDPQAARLLAELRLLLAPHRSRTALPRIEIKGEPFVVRRGDRLTAILPQLRLVGRLGQVRVGTVRLAVNEEAGGVRTARLMLPGQAVLRDQHGRLRLALTAGAVTIQGGWTAAGLSATKSEFSDLAVATPDGLTVSVGRVSASRRTDTTEGRPQQIEQISAEGLRLPSGAVDRMSLEARWPAAVMPRQAFNLAAGEPGPAMLLSLYQLPLALPTVLAPLTLAQQGPLGEMAADDGGLTAALLEADSDLAVEDLTVEAGGIDVSAIGAFKAAPGGLIGALDLAVRTGAGQPDGLLAGLAALADKGRPGKDGLGRSVSIMPAMVMPGGSLLLNGQDAGELLGR